MTPTLMGRWETRLLLLGTIGLAVTLIFGQILADLMTPLAVLGYVLVIGLLWDILYGIVQNFRWDRDWPPVFQLLAGIVEGVFLWGVILLANAQFEGLPIQTTNLRRDSFYSCKETLTGKNTLRENPLRLCFFAPLRELLVPP